MENKFITLYPVYFSKNVVLHFQISSDLLDHKWICNWVQSWIYLLCSWKNGGWLIELWKWINSRRQIPWTPLKPQLHEQSQPQMIEKKTHWDYLFQAQGQKRVKYPETSFCCFVPEIICEETRHAFDGTILSK